MMGFQKTLATTPTIGNQKTKLLQNIASRKTQGQITKIEFDFLKLSMSIPKLFPDSISTAFNTLETQAQKEWIDALVELASNDSWHIRQTLAKTFAKLPEIPEDRLKSIVKETLNLLEDEDYRVRQAAAKTLGAISHQFPKSVLNTVLLKLILLLQDKNWSMVETTVHALANLSITPDYIHQYLNHLMPNLLNDLWPARQAAPQVLGDLSHILKGEVRTEAENKLLQMMEDKDWRVRLSVAKALVSHKKPREDILVKVIDKLILWLGDSDLRVRQGTIQILARLNQFPENKLEDIVQMLKPLLAHDNWRDQWIGVQAFGALTKIPAPMLDDILLSLLPHLAHDRYEVRSATVQATGALIRNSEKNDILVTMTKHLIIQKLDDDDWHIKLSAIKALDSLSNVPQEMIESSIDCLIELLNNEHWEIQQAAIKTIATLNKIPKSKGEELTDALIKQLQNDGYICNQTILIALSNIWSDNISSRLQNLEDHFLLSLPNPLITMPDFYLKTSEHKTGFTPMYHGICQTLDSTQAPQEIPNPPNHPRIK